MKPIHPFPARMAPDVARDVIGTLQPGQRVVDSMCGSGTVLRLGVEAGLDCVGYDIDPLAVLMASAWTTPVPAYRLLHDAHSIVDRARNLSAAEVALPWCDDETDAFARYWFGHEQIATLARLAAAVKQTRFGSRDLLRLCLSRVIVTKDRGASLARDVSHSRPHRVMDTNSFDVYTGFLRASRHVARTLQPEVIRGRARVEIGDARTVSEKARSFDAAITSPPYLNAIDYLRGHRLALIWFGYPLAALSDVRASQVGAERSLDASPFDVSRFVHEEAGRRTPDRYIGWLRRYAADMMSVMNSLQRLVRPGGRVVVVVGNSTIRGASFDNAGIIEECAVRLPLSLMQRREREIPPRRRYLPPPGGGSALAQRMRSEAVLTFAVDA